MTKTFSNATPTSKQRVLIIGAGQRVQNNFLPVLACLHDRFELIGIHSRTASRLLSVASHWNVPAVMNLRDVDWLQVEIVIISVPVSQNAQVLNQLSAYVDRLRLVIDTPVAWNIYELAECLPIFRRCQQVIVAEDYMNFPTFQFVRELLAKGVIGKPQALTLYNMGFYYHGLALIRSFSGFKPVLSSGSNSIGHFSCNVTYHLLGGFKACVIGPYRRYDNGGFILEGSCGIITQVASHNEFGQSRGKPVYVLCKSVQDNQLSGYTLQDEADKVLYRLELPFIHRMRDMPFEDKSDLNLLRGCGLIHIFQSFYDHENINHKYDVSQALYDSFVSRLASAGKLPVDPVLLLNTNIMFIIQLVAVIFRCLSKIKKTFLQLTRYQGG